MAILPRQSVTSPRAAITANSKLLAADSGMVGRLAVIAYRAELCATGKLAWQTGIVGRVASLVVRCGYQPLVAAMLTYCRAVDSVNGCPAGSVERIISSGNSTTARRRRKAA